jgi:hypothetical protein
MPSLVRVALFVAGAIVLWLIVAECAMGCGGGGVIVVPASYFHDAGDEGG